jgi:hypothetical protein
MIGGFALKLPSKVVVLMGAVAVSSLTWVTTASADPFDDAVRAETRRVVPEFWSIEDVRIEPLGGDRARISAQLKLAAPTFVIDSQEGPFTFVRPAAETGLEKTLTGVATGGRLGKPLKLDFGDAALLDSVGKPLTALPGRTVLAGSDDGRALRGELDAWTRSKVDEEKDRRQRETVLAAEQTAAAKAEAGRIEAERALMDQRVRRLSELNNRLNGRDRPARIAATETALAGNDLVARQLAVEAALQSRDPVLSELAVRDWLGQRKSVPIELYAVKEDPQSDAVLANLGPLTLTVDSIDAQTGAVAATLGAPGYGVTRPSAAAGYLTRGDLTLNTFGCSLMLRLSDHRSLDGLYRCQTLATLAARIVLD